MDLFVGVYGGHHESAAVALANEDVIGHAIGESLNFHTYDHETVGLRLADLLRELAHSASISPKHFKDKTTRLCVAFPGAANDNDHELALRCLEDAGWKDANRFQIADDTWAGLIADALVPYGICAFAGTGASVFVGNGTMPNGKLDKFDGWGPVLGDFGSGFQIAVELFRMIGRHIDSHGTAPAIFEELIRKAPKIASSDNAQQWFDSLHILYPSDWRVRFAALTSVVTRAAEQARNPDVHAVRLIRRAAAQMALTIHIAIQRCKPVSETLPIIFQGGMFEHSMLYRNSVGKVLHRLSHRNEIRMASRRAVLGASFIAMAPDTFSPDSQQVLNIDRNIRSLPARTRNALIYEPWSYNGVGARQS